MVNSVPTTLLPIDHLRTIPFVTDLQYASASQGGDLGVDGELRVTAPQGSFTFVVEVKRSFLSLASATQFLAWLPHLQNGSREVVLFARYIPRKAAEALIAAHVNFADDAGNVHLQLGNAYHWTRIGLPAPARVSERRAPSPAQLQLLFHYAAKPESVNWPVRQLETSAGVSKSKAAQARHQMLVEDLLVRSGKEYRLGSANVLAERLIAGYTQVLRPKLLVGRFRPAEKTTESFLERLLTKAPSGVRYALTGGPAAGLLQHFYQGPDVPLFLQPSERAVIQELRLLPDREGPVTILKAFGEIVFWEKREQHMLAPPWLIYAELLSSNDPRAHEAAQELRREFLA